MDQARGIDVARIRRGDGEAVADAMQSLWTLANGIGRTQAASPIDPVGTFAATPPSPRLGMRRVITDSTTAVWGGVIAGGGANVVQAWFNGTNWTVTGA